MQGEVESDGPSESECRPYIEKALKELEAGEVDEAGALGDADSKEDVPTVEITTDDSDRDGDDDANEGAQESAESTENEQNDDAQSTEDAGQVTSS